MHQKNFAKILKEIREAKNMTQGNVARAVNIARTTYSNYEQGRTTPSTDTLYKLSNILETDLVGVYFQNLLLTNLNSPNGNSPISYSEYKTLLNLYSKIPNNSRILLLDYLKNTISNREEIR